MRFFGLCLFRVTATKHISGLHSIFSRGKQLLYPQPSGFILFEVYEVMEEGVVKRFRLEVGKLMLSINCHTFSRPFHLFLSLSTKLRPINLIKSSEGEDWFRLNRY